MIPEKIANPEFRKVLWWVKEVLGHLSVVYASVNWLSAIAPKLLKSISLKGRTFVLTRGFRGLRTVAFELLVRQRIGVGTAWWNKAAHYI